jgi:hypothetical protein
MIFRGGCGVGRGEIRGRNQSAQSGMIDGGVSESVVPAQNGVAGQRLRTRSIERRRTEQPMNRNHRGKNSDDRNCCD